MTTRIRLLSLTVLAGVLAFLGAGCSKEAKKAGYLERADRDFRAGQYEKAEIEYRNVLALDAANPGAIRNLAHIYYDRGDVPKAFVFLQRAKTLEPANLDLRFKLGLIYLAAGKFTEARAEDDFILGKDSGHEGGLQLLVELARTTNDLEAVRQRLEGLRPQLANRPALPLALGTLLLRKGDFKGAEAEFQKVLVLNPNSSEAHHGLGHVHLAQKDLKRAEQEYQTAANFAPLRSAVHLRLAGAKMMAGDPDGGRRVLEDLSRKAPDYIPVLIRLAELSFAKKEYDECDSLIRRVLALDPINLEAATLSARLKLAKGQTDKAVAELERVVQTRPRSAQAQYQLALARLLNKDAGNAMTTLRQVLTLEPNFFDAALLLAELHLNRGEYASAVSLLTPFTKQKPVGERAQMLLARASREQGKWDDALNRYRELREAGSKNPMVPYDIGLILRYQKKPAEARAAYEQALELAPDYLPAIDQLVELDIADKKFDAATRRAEALAGRNPKAAEPVFLLAKIHAATGNVRQTETDLLRVIELNPEFTKAYLVLAQLYAGSNRQPEAQKKLTESLSRNPRDRGTLMLLAMLQNQTGSYAEARSTYERLLSFYPDFAPALNNLAFLYAEQFKQLDKAQQLAQKARLSFPANPTIADTLGWIFFLRRDYAAAVNLLRESTAGLPAEAEVQYHLGMAQYMMGEEAPAQASLQRANHLKPDHPGRSQADRRLAILSLDPSKADAKVIGTLEEAAEQHPEDPVAARRLASVYEAQGAWAKARSVCERLLSANPKSVPALVRLAQLQSERFGEQAKALELARKARELDPDSPQIAQTLGRLAYQAGDHKWSLSLLQESNRKNPGDATVLYDLAFSFYGLGRVAEAASSMQDAVQRNLDPARSAEAKKFISLCSLFDNAPEAERAAPQIQEILNRSPDYAPALMAAAALYARKGNPMAARQACEKVLALYPFFAPAHKLLAQLHSGPDGDLAKAYEHGTKAREAFPGDAEVAKTLGIVVFRRGDFARAVELLKESARKKAQDADLRFYLGMAHLQLKQKTEARQALNQALEMKLDAPLAESARKALTELK